MNEIRKAQKEGLERVIGRELTDLEFDVRGMKYGPGHYRIDVKDPEPWIMVCTGDIETFKAWRETQREPQR